MRSQDQPLAFEASERFAYRRVGDVELLDEIVDCDPRTGRDLQRHELGKNRLVHILHEAVGPRNIECSLNLLRKSCPTLIAKICSPLDKRVDITMLVRYAILYPIGFPIGLTKHRKRPWRRPGLRSAFRCASSNILAPSSSRCERRKLANDLVCRGKATPRNPVRSRSASRYRTRRRKAWPARACLHGRAIRHRPQPSRKSSSR